MPLTRGGSAAAWRPRVLSLLVVSCLVSHLYMHPTSRVGAGRVTQYRSRIGMHADPVRRRMERKSLKAHLKVKKKGPFEYQSDWSGLPIDPYWGPENIRLAAEEAANEAARQARLAELAARPPFEDLDWVGKLGRVGEAVQNTWHDIHQRFFTWEAWAGFPINAPKNEYGQVRYPASPDEARMAWVNNKYKEGGFMPGVEGKEFFIDGEKWVPQQAGGHPDFPYHIGPQGENLGYYGKWDPLDPENWISTAEYSDANLHMFGMQKAAEKPFWEKLMFWKKDEPRTHWLAPGGEGTDDFRFFIWEDENGNGPDDEGYLGYNKTLDNGTEVRVPPWREPSLNFWMEQEDGSMLLVEVDPSEGRRPPQYDNWWIRFYNHFNQRKKTMLRIGGGEPTELGTYGPIWHKLPEKYKPDDLRFRDPRWSEFD